MTGLLREPLTADQLRLLRVIFEPFDESGLWPLWQYVDLTMDAQYGLDAAAVLDSLPATGARGTMSQAYGLTWRDDMHLAPQARSRVCLTVAGLRYLDKASPLLAGFLALITLMISKQRDLQPDPQNIVEAEFSSGEIAHLARLDAAGGDGAGMAAEARKHGIDKTALKLRQMLEHEPWTYSFHRPDPNAEQWTVRVPAVLREYRDIDAIDGYIDRTIALWVPQEAPSAPLSASPLDIPTAVGYLDAVSRNATGSGLFASLDPVSVARLTQSCEAAEEFNSMMSALADVLGQVVKPGKSKPPQQGALEEVRDWLVPQLDAAAADRVAEAFGTLVRLRLIRVSQQHSDARHKAVAAFGAIGLPFPPASWYQAWAQVAVMARGALDVIREEVHAGLQPP